jgi:adenylate kinase family enzyme
MKITIIGLPGSGKSILAEKISTLKNISYIHIDSFWREGGGGHNSRTTPNPEQTHNYVQKKVLEKIKQDSWVSDGFYPLIQTEVVKEADEIIFLDISLLQRLFNHMKRTIFRKKRNNEMTLWADLMFFFEMMGSGSTKTSKINNFLKPYQDKTTVLKSRKEIEKYLKFLI